MEGVRTACFGAWRARVCLLGAPLRHLLCSFVPTWREMLTHSRIPAPNRLHHPPRAELPGHCQRRMGLRRSRCTCPDPSLKVHQWSVWHSVACPLAHSASIPFTVAFLHSKPSCRTLGYTTRGPCPCRLPLPHRVQLAIHCFGFIGAPPCAPTGPPTTEPPSAPSTPDSSLSSARGIAPAKRARTDRRPRHGLANADACSGGGDTAAAAARAAALGPAWAPVVEALEDAHDEMAAARGRHDTAALTGWSFGGGIWDVGEGYLSRYCGGVCRFDLISLRAVMRIRTLTPSLANSLRCATGCN